LSHHACSNPLDASRAFTRLCTPAPSAGLRRAESCEVKQRLSVAIALVASTVLSGSAAAQDFITVDANVVLADVARKPIGININFLLDDDDNRPTAIERLADALKKAGVKYLRYPGGEKSDNYLWSVPPFTTPAPTLARWAAAEWPQNQEWPSYDRMLVESDGRTFKTAPLDFDEFMQVCRAIDCVPTIVICYDSMYKPAQTGGIAPTREQLLETAREWVRYANVVKGYNVAYWEIGNESDHWHYNGGTTADNYARDLIEFSRVMKAIDATILVGANGNSNDWWRTILSTASSAIDFLAVHNYPATNWGSYTYYQTHDVNLLSPVQIAQKAINAYAPAADRSRLTIAVTEINSADWSGGWAPINNLGHALALFDAFGAHLAHPKVAFTQLWNTRWSGNDTATTPVLWDALDKHNQLQATGRATAIWGQFLKDALVVSSSTANVRSYATLSAATGGLSVLLINKDTVAHSTTVTVKNAGTNFAVDTWTFTGTSASDVYPVWQNQGQHFNAGSAIAITLAPVSITVLDLVPQRAVHAVPGTIQAEDFDDGTYWDSTRGNTGTSYRATDVDIQVTTDTTGGFNVGWIAAGESLKYSVNVQTSGTYDISARVASPYAGKALRVLVDGKDVTGSVAIPNTGGWQKWQTVIRSRINLDAGAHAITIVAITDGFNFNWLSVAATPTQSFVATLQAEDFRSDAYWDSTTANLGNAYRATGVDIQPTADAGGGFNIGWVAPGEWQEHDLTVPVPGYHDVAARVASPYGDRSFRILVDGVDVTGTVTGQTPAAIRSGKRCRVRASSSPRGRIACASWRSPAASISTGCLWRQAFRSARPADRVGAGLGGRFVTPSGTGRRPSTSMVVDDLQPMATTPDDSRLELLQGTLDMLILRTLQWGPQHGHGIGQAIKAQSDDVLKVETGSLYPALHRLEKRGWLKSEWGVSEANQRAKYYQLTAMGKAQLLRERDRWSQLVKAIGRIMNPAPGQE
jgi:alpha-L-arabinofuranosidase